MKRIFSLVILFAITLPIIAVGQSRGNAVDPSKSTQGRAARYSGTHPGNSRSQTDRRVIQQRHVRRFAGEIKELYDDNHDGVIDAKERKALIAELEAEPLKNNTLQALAMAWKVIRVVDEDGNFEISDKEAAKITEVMDSLHSEFEAKRHLNPGRRDGGRLPAGRTDSFGVRDKSEK